MSLARPPEEARSLPKGQPRSAQGALLDAAAEVVRAAQRLVPLGLATGTSGNVSVRAPGGMLVTPSGTPYETLRPQDIVFVGDDGRWSHRLAPSSEWRMHLTIYRARPEAGAVVHGHPTYSTVLAIRRMEIPALHYMIAAAGGPTIRCAAYATFGTEALSDAALAALDGRKACLLANHGLLAFERNLDRAMWLAVESETLARQYVLTLMLGGPTLLPDDEIERVAAKFASYGMSSPEQG